MQCLSVVLSWLCAQMLHNPIASSRHVSRWRTCWTCWHWQDRDDQRHGKSSWQVCGRVQLLWPNGLPRSRSNLQRPCAVGIVGLFRRIQPYWVASFVRRSATDLHRSSGQEEPFGKISILGWWHSFDESRVWTFSDNGIISCGFWT